MSSIERAMEKLSGGGADDPLKRPVADPSADATVATEASPPKDTQVQHEQPASSGAHPAAAPLPVLPTVETREVPPQESAPPERTAAKSSDQSSTASSAAIPAHTPSAQLVGDVTIIDFNRLAAAGFLVPGQTMTREAEEFQRIKRRLLGNMVPGVYASARPSNLVLITSSVPSEGKTFISVNLAISLAMEIDRTVLAIDTDIVKRDMSKVFGVVGRPGLFDLLADPSLKLQDLLVRTSVSNLTILPAGNRHTSSTEMLASQRMRELTDEIAARYRDRVILFDSPPVLAMTTASALAPLVGQVIVVCEAGKTKHETIKETLHRLEEVRVTGVILNKSKQAYAPGYDYYGSYHQTR